MERITNILKQYIYERIPAKATNIFFQMFNGIEAMFKMLEYRLDISKRERNILTAQSLASLRSLAANNGYEPKLRTPAKGLLMIKISPKLYSRVGYPLFIKPYSFFTDKLTKLDYYYITDRTIRLDSSTYYIPVVEGFVQTQTHQVPSGTIPENIVRFYIQEEKVAEDSILVEVNGTSYLEVKSFFDNEGLNDNKQFMVKFSNDAQNPIILYVRGLSENQTINITYRLTNGELGNLDTQVEFETESIVDSYGQQVIPTKDEMTIININGFTLGSNGTDENALRCAIGFNHSITLLFDNISYRNFLSKFSTILVQDIKINKEHKQINDIYIWKKHYFDNNINVISAKDMIKQYNAIVDTKAYIVPEADKIELNHILAEYEYCLSSHNLYDPVINKYALQIMFNSIEDLNNYSESLELFIYSEFAKFFYIRNHNINLEILFDYFKNVNEVSFDYILFDSNVEQYKIKNQTDIETPYIIYHTVDADKDYNLKSLQNNKNYTQNIEGPWLPILKGDFDICDKDYQPVRLYNNINFVVRK